MTLFAFPKPHNAFAADNDSDGEATRLAREAAQLLDTWKRLARQHVSLSFGCSCGVGGVAVQLADFEQDIADFLVAEAERRERPDILAFLQTHARATASGTAGGEDWSVTHLLGELARRDPPPDTAEIRAMLVETLGRTLGSFASLHDTGFACS